MTVNVGSVSVQVVPDAREFDRRLKADLARTPDVKVNVGADTTKAKGEVDRFLLDTAAKSKLSAQKAGEDSGGLLATGMRNSFMRNSPLLAAGVAAGLAAGAPAAIAGAGILFGGIAAVALKSNEQVKAAAAGAGAEIKSTFTEAAQVLVPTFVGALNRIGTAVAGMEPEFHQAFAALAGPLDSLTSGVIAMTQNAMPGLVSAIRGAGPVFAGLSSLLAEIGTGLGQFFQIVSQHGGAAGQVFAAIGKIVQELLPILGQLVGAGAELASRVLPPIADALGLVASVLDKLAPALPLVVGGFLAFKAITALSGPLDALAGKLANIGSVGAAASGVLGDMKTALPAIAASVAILGAAWEASSQQIDSWAQGLEQGGQAAVTATQQLQDAHTRSIASAHSLSDAWGIVKGAFADGLAQIQGYSSAQAEATQESKDQYNALTPLGKAQADVTRTQNDYLYAVDKWGKNSGQAVAASDAYRDANNHLKDVQGLLTQATKGATTAAQDNATRLQAIATASSQATGQINLLKGAFDALTGKQVSETEAQIAVTQAVNNAITSVKGLHGGLVDANGALTVQTEKGAAAQQALIQLRNSDNTLIGTMIKHGATSDQVSAKDAYLRSQFIQTAEKMGYTASQAKTLADQIYGIPTKRNVEITADTDPAAAALNRLVGKFQSVNFGTALHARAFAEGGYTGPGGKYTPAGIVHAGEFVVPKEAVDRIGVSNLAAISGLPGYATGGPVGYAGGGLVGSSSLMRYLVELTQAGASSFNAGLQRALGSITSVAGVGGGASRWAGVVEQVMGMLGLPQAALAGILNIIQHESGGNPNAINLTDSNARAGHPSQGLMQTIPGTFYRWAGPFAGRGITDPLANVYAGTNYALHTYGLGMLSGGGRHTTVGRYLGYDSGGLLPPGPSMVYNGTGAPELIAPPQTFKQVVSEAAGGSGGQFEGNLYLDSGEFLGKVRGEARKVTDGRLKDLYRKTAHR